DASPPGFKLFHCAGYQLMATTPATAIFTAEIFLRKWGEMAEAGYLKPGQTVWIFQAGWDIGLAQQLQGLTEYHDLKVKSFGRNITIFRLSVDRTLPGRVGLPRREG